MNVKELRAEMVLHDDTGETLAKALNISRQTLSRKMNDNGAEFTQSEIGIIKNRYDLSGDRINAIFFAEKVS